MCLFASGSPAYQSDNGNGTFSNPVLYADYPDPDICRAGSDFYMVSTTFADSPGISVLHSKDLVNWELAGHCATNLDWSGAYNTMGGYRAGFWAGGIRYYNGTFYVAANPTGANGRIYYATNPAGPWQYYSLNRGIYDPSLLIDTNGAGYIVEGHGPQNVLTLNGSFSQIVSVSNNVVNSGGEGSHVVRAGAYYYLFNANPGVWPYELRCSRATNIFGPWETNHVCLTETTGGHQGGMVDLDNTGTNWFGFTHQDSGAVGRMTRLGPVYLTNGWPVFGSPGAPNQMGASYPKPVLGQTVTQPAASDEFTNSTLGLQWQWNQNPDNTRWSLTARTGYLRLMPTQATNVWYARNTLTQKGQGPLSCGVVKFDVSNLKSNDMAGFGTLGKINARIYVTASASGSKTLGMDVDNRGVGAYQAVSGVPYSGNTIYLRADLDFNRGLGICSYSADGSSWTLLGGQFPLDFDITYSTFQGEKFAISCFNALTGTSAGYVDVDSFTLSNTAPLVTGIRGRPRLNAARTTLVADNGQLLRGPYTSTEWTTGADNASLASMKKLGFNAIHLYAESFDASYPTNGSTVPGYSSNNVDRIVAATRTNGLYLIITIGNGANNGSYNAAYVTNFWNFYAPRYANESHVLFEIQNEPVAWGPPYSSSTATPTGAINMEVAAYKAIRAVAPNTPVLLFTYAVLSGSSGASAALKDIQSFNTNVFGATNAVWTNEAVAFHGYAGWQNAAIAASNLLSAGYPCFMTEFTASPWDTLIGGLDTQLAAQLERLGVSWLTFNYVPPSGVSSDVTVPQNYQTLVTNSGLSWAPDSGTWPVARGPYGNGGRPWTTPDFTNNTLAGTLRLEAENFDWGGQGVAYSDSISGNSGGQYRTNESVDIEATVDTGGGYDVIGSSGEWLEYTLWVSEPGLYDLKLRVAAAAAGSVQLLAGVASRTNLTGSWTVPSSGGSQTWITLTNTVFLSPGQQVLHLDFLTGTLNLNWLEFTPVKSGRVTDGAFKILNRGSALALQGDAVNGKLTAGSDVSATVQQWNFLHLGGNLYRITSVSNSWSWNANGNASQMGFVWWWAAGGSQCFYIKPTDSGYYRIMPAQDGLSVESASTNLAVVDEALYGGSASQQWGIVVPGAPDFPTGLTVSPLSATQVYLAWNAVPGATSYNVKRGTNSAGPFTTIASGVTATNYTDASVVSGVAYYYVISALIGSSESLNSASVGAPLPYPWQTQDVGSVGVAGGAACSNGVFAVTGSGADIWNVADAFRYAYVTAAGDCTVIARVVSVQAVDAWSKAGVMIRSSLASNAPNAFVAVTPGNGVTWQYRSTTNGSSSYANTTGLSAPYWVKLARKANTFTGSRSPDGTNWTQQGTAQTITMGSTVYVGLALSSHNNSSLCSATFDNVTAPGWPVPAPPSAPAGLTASAISNSQISLLWNGVTNATGYNVKRSASAGGPWTVIGGGLTNTNYVDSGLAFGMAYYYVVTSLNAGGESTNSAQASATTLLPPQPRIVSAAIRAGALVLSGTNGLSGGGFTVFSSTNLTAPLAAWTQVGSGSFDSNGCFLATNALNAGERARFFLIRQL